MQRILAITHQYTRLGNDGLAPYNRHQLRCLAQDHAVEVIAPIPWTARFRSGYENFMAQPKRYRNKDGIWVHHPVYLFPPKVLMRRYGNYFLSSVRGVAEPIVERFRPEVIFSCWAHPDGWAAVQLGREYGLPVLIKVIGSDVLVLTKDPGRRQRVAEALQGADGVAAVSRDLADHVIGLGVDPAKVHVVPEGINQEVFCPGDQGEARARLKLPSEGPAQLLFVGNLLLSKGAGVLLEACALLKQRRVEFRCHLVGRGQDEPQLRVLAARLGLSGGSGAVVDFVGSCPQWQLPDWYRASDLVVLPSFSEGIPNVLREAMMCGTAFVATNVGGIPEITRPEVGRLVEAGDPRQLADAIEKALDEGLRADRATALELNISWEQSARLLAGELAKIQIPTPVAVDRRFAVSVEPKMKAPETRLEEGKGVRILAITQIYPRPRSMTAGSYNVNQFQSINRENPVSVICPASWTEFRLGQLWRKKDIDALTPSVDAIQDQIRVDRPVFLFLPKLFRSSYGLFYGASIRKCFNHVVETFRPDVVLACWSHPDGWAAVRLAREHGLPVLIKVHGSDVLVLAKDPRRRQRVAEALREADGVAAVSRDLADHVIGLGVDPAKVHVVPHGIDPEIFCPGDQSAARAQLNLPNGGPAQLLFVGNLLMSKGAGVLLEACALLKQRRVGLRCHLVGRGQDEPQLRVLAARLGLSGGSGAVVDFVGSCPQWQLPDWYRASDLVVLPSFSEGIPNVLREAMMCGTAFVATNVGGIPEITRPEVGRLVEAGDPRQLADAIEKALADGFRADRAMALELNISWDESAKIMVDRLRSLPRASHPLVAR